MKRRKKIKCEPTNAEKVAPLFTACDCGVDDSERHRLRYVWQDGEKTTSASSWFTGCSFPVIREVVMDAEFENGRPTILVRVKPRPELIAMADKIGSTVQ